MEALSAVLGGRWRFEMGYLVYGYLFEGCIIGMYWLEGLKMGLVRKVISMDER